METVKWGENNITIPKPKKPKKVTGTRFASILGRNAWDTPFQVWCEITRTYAKPFEDNIYTIAGKTIEPKVIEYLGDIYYGRENLITPEDKYGKDYFKKTWGDFFKAEHDILGGMWDCLYVDKETGAKAVIEIKTTKRSQDWLNEDGQIESPDYYALQASLYAYLLGWDDVVMCVSFLEEGDYDDPDSYVPSAYNTQLEHFKVSERYPEFDYLVEQVLDWYATYVGGGKSPYFDEKKDKEYLDGLRKNVISTPSNSDISSAVATADEMYKAIRALEQQYKEETKSLYDTYKSAESEIRAYLEAKFRDGDKKVEIAGPNFTFTLSKNVKESVDIESLKRNGLHEYITETVSYRLNKKEIK